MVVSTHPGINNVNGELVYLRGHRKQDVKIKYYILNWGKLFEVQVTTQCENWQILYQINSESFHLT